MTSFDMPGGKVALVAAPSAKRTDKRDGERTSSSLAWCQDERPGTSGGKRQDDSPSRVRPCCGQRGTRDQPGDQERGDSGELAQSSRRRRRIATRTKS
jgi:hypothetical protein